MKKTNNGQALAKDEIGALNKLRETLVAEID